MKNKSEKILVTGSDGFIGKKFVKELEKNGYEVVNSIEGKKIDVTNFEDLKKIQYVGKVVHLGALVGIEQSKIKLREYFQVNTVGTLNLLEICKIKKIPKFIYISTYVYGKPQYLPIDENHPINPHSPYNESKYLAERICKNYSKLASLDVIILRPFGVFGPAQKKNFFIHRILEGLINGNTITVNSKIKRDYLYIDDFIEVLIRCLSYDTNFDIFNVGSGNSYSFLDIKLALESLTGKNLIFKEDNIPVDVEEIYANITKIKNKLDWSPKLDLKSGLKLLLSSEYSIL